MYQNIPCVLCPKITEDRQRSFHNSTNIVNWGRYNFNSLNPLHRKLDENYAPKVQNLGPIIAYYYYLARTG